MLHTLSKVLAFAICIYLIYFLVFGILIYAFPKKVTQEFIKQHPLEKYYGPKDSFSVDRVGLVERPEDGFDLRLYILENAKESITMSYYFVKLGYSANTIYSSLISAADRGVKVKIILDGITGAPKGASRKYLDLFTSHSNIEIKYYEPLNLLKPWTINSRLHDKYIIVDGHLLLMGGRNIADKYYNPKNYKGAVTYDRDVLVYSESKSDNSVIRDAESYFTKIWNSRYVKTLKKELTESEYREALLLKNDLMIKLDSYRDEYDMQGYKLNYKDITVPTNKVSFVANPIHSGRKEPECAYIVFNILANCKSNVLIQTPYTVTNRDMRLALKYIGDLVPRVDYLTNSLASTPNLTAFSMYLKERKKLLDLGYTIYEYQSEDSIHGKSYLGDDDISAVGSLNLDIRSNYINTETMLIIHSTEFNKIMRDEIDNYFDKSLVVNRDNESYVVNPNIKEVPVAKSKKIIANILYPILFLVKYLI